MAGLQDLMSGANLSQTQLRNLRVAANAAEDLRSARATRGAPSQSVQDAVAQELIGQMPGTDWQGGQAQARELYALGGQSALRQAVAGGLGGSGRGLSENLPFVSDDEVAALRPSELRLRSARRKRQRRLELLTPNLTAAMESGGGATGGILAGSNFNPRATSLLSGTAPGYNTNSGRSV